MSVNAAGASAAKELLAAWQLALRAENAAIWAYALVGAGDSDNPDRVQDMRAAHLVLRDATAEQISAGGGTPVAPAAAYTVSAVQDAASARSLAMQLETDCAQAWRAVVGSTDDDAQRTFASSALSGAAVRLVRWRIIAGTKPATVAFPGATGPS